MKPGIINSRQLIAALLISRFFTMLVAQPNSRYELTGLGGLLPPLLSVGATAVLLLPLIFLMKKYPRRSLSLCAGEVAPSIQKPILLWQLLLCLICAVATVSQSEYFVTNALYPDARREWVILLFLLVVCYLCILGLEPLSRAALIICGLIIGSFLLIFSGVAGQLDFLELSSPLLNPTENILRTTLAYWGQQTELLLLCILQPYTNKPRFGRDLFTVLGGGLLVTELLSLFTLLVLGDYGKTRMFPVYTLAALSGHGFFSRLDYLHILNWTFACILRCALFSWAAVLLLQELFPKGDIRKQRAIVFALLTAAALLLVELEGGYAWFYQLFATGIPLLVSLVLLPGLLLLLHFFKGRKVQP